MVAVPVIAAAVGLAFTVTTAFPDGLVTVQPLASVTEVNVYVVVLAGLIIDVYSNKSLSFCIFPIN